MKKKDSSKEITRNINEKRIVTTITNNNKMKEQDSRRAIMTIFTRKMG